MKTVPDTCECEWFALRDLKRYNALSPAWKSLTEKGFEVFTPMHWRIFELRGKKIRKYVPVIQDLVFVYSTRDKLDPVILSTETLQYRFVKNCKGQPMTVPSHDMNRFIQAVNDTEKITFYAPDELTTDKIGRKVRIIGGRLNGYEGNLLSLRGSKFRRLIVELPEFLYACVEINPEYIQIL